MDGLSITLKDSTDDEVPEGEVVQEMDAQHIITDDNIQISEYQVGPDGEQIAVVYSSASDMPIIMSASDVNAAMQAQCVEGANIEVVDEEEGPPQEIVMTEVESLPQDIQATILNTIEGIKTVQAENEETHEQDVHEQDVHEQDVHISIELEQEIQEEEDDPEEQIVIEMPQVCRPETTSITTITRSEHTLDSLVPPQILATEDEPMATSPDGFSLVTLPHEVISVSSQGSKPGEDGGDNQDMVVDVENEEVSIAKFVPLSGDTMFDSPKSGSHGKARIVSITGVGSSQMEVVPNFMEGSENDDLNNRDMIKMGGSVLNVGRVVKVQGSGARTLDLGSSESSAFQLSESESKEETSAIDDGSDVIPISDGQIQITGGIALTSADLAKLIAEGKLPPDILKFVTTDDGKSVEVTSKPKGKKGKNEMLHGMQLLSECAMRMEEQDEGGQEDEEEQEASEENNQTIQEQEFIVGAPHGATGRSEPLRVVHLQSAIDGVHAGQQVIHIQASDLMQAQEQMVESHDTTGEGEEHLVVPTSISHGEHVVHEVINIETEQGSKQVVVPVHVTSEMGHQLGQTQHVVMDSQQISEELIPMVQEEVILEIVEGGEEIVVNTSSGNATIVGGMYGTDKATFLPLQNLTSSILQHGLPSCHPLETYSQEIHSRKKVKGKGKKKPQKRKRLDSEPSTSSDGKLQRFQCHVCSKIFDRMRHLRDHLLVHYNTKGYVCDFCNKSFSSSSHLRRHVMIHTGERPHKCDYCQEGFIQAVQLRVHKERHGHGPPPPLSRAPPRKGKDGKKSKKKKKKKEKIKEKPPKKKKVPTATLR